MADAPISDKYQAALQRLQQQDAPGTATSASAAEPVKRSAYADPVIIGQPSATPAAAPVSSASQMSGGIVEDAPKPNVMQNQVEEMRRISAGEPDAQGNYPTSQQRKTAFEGLRNQARQTVDQAQGAAQGKFTMPAEPDRTLVRVGPEVNTNPDRTLALRPEAATPEAEAAASEALAGSKGIGALLKGAGKKSIPLVGDALYGYEAYKESGDPLRGVVAGAGSLAGRTAAGLLGIESGPADFIVQGLGGYGGQRLATGAYDKLTGYKPKTAEQPAQQTPQAPVAQTPAAPATPADDEDKQLSEMEAASYRVQQNKEAAEKASLDRYHNFIDRVHAERNLESALGVGPSADPIANANAASDVAAAAMTRAKLEGGSAERFLPEADPRHHNPIMDMARQELRMASAGKTLNPADRLAYGMAMTPVQYGNPLQAQADKHALTMFAPEMEANKTAQQMDIAQSNQTLDYAKFAQTDRHFYDNLNRATEVANTRNVGHIVSTREKLMRDAYNYQKSLLNPQTMIDPKVRAGMEQRLKYTDQAIKIMDNKLSELGEQTPEEGVDSGGQDGVNIPPANRAPLSSFNK
jgi:hypothetical protein